MIDIAVAKPRISDHISYQEATKSNTAIREGIINTPNAMQLEAMQYAATHLFEPCRAHFGGKPLYISSFFRCDRLNNCLGSSSSSFHCKGMAIDLDADVFKHQTNKQLFDFFYLGNIKFTELVWEYGSEHNPDWVHVAINPAGQRRMVKRAYVQGGKKHIKAFDLY